jgi:hypothetical protein
MACAYRRNLGTVLATIGLPYRYTLTVWASGELVTRVHHGPTVGEVFLFVTGAAAAYALLRLLVGRIGVAQASEPHGFMRASAVHAAAIGAAVGVAAILAEAPTVPAWALAPFGSTLTYLVVAALEQA